MTDPQALARFSRVAAVASAQVVIPTYGMFSRERFAADKELGSAKSLDDLSPALRALVQPIFDEWHDFLVGSTA